MRWPKQAAESVRPSRFRPPFCPQPDCVAHRTRARGFQRFGYYHRKYDPTRIPRFRCRECLHTCSRQTFSTTYYLKRPHFLVAVAAGLVACAAHRQIARSLHCAKTTVTRLAERLGRHALLFHARVRSHLPRISEPIVHDHFETFIGQQDRALGIGTAVGSSSRFVYDIDPAPHRGSGRRPDRTVDPSDAVRPNRPYVASIRRTIQALIPQVSDPERLVLVVDGRADYNAAVRSLEGSSRVELRAYPNPVRGPKGTPRSAETVARDLAMFPVDQLHQLLRHSCADHKRETLAFGRRLESIVARAYLMAVWKNFLKARSERAPDRSTPAMRLGLTDTPWRWEWVLSRRLFPTREGLSDTPLQLYRKLLTAHFPPLRLRDAG